MGYQALLFCPDEKAARGVTQVLSELDFTVEPCTEPFAAVKKLMAQHFDAIVVDCDNEQNATLLFKSARNSSSNQSSLAVAVVEGQAGVAKAFRIGANLVLTKPINVEQAKGTLRVARGLLRKGGDVAAKPNADAAAAPVGASAPANPAKPPAGLPKPAPSAPRSAQPAPGAPSPASGKAWPSPPKNVAPARTQPDGSTASAPAMAAESPKSTNSPKIEAPSKAVKPAATTTQPAAPQTKYPWQASKPGAEPMASALKKAAEAAGIAPPPIPQPVSPETPQVKPPAGPSTLGSAAAPAPAKEKTPLPVPVPEPAVFEKAAVAEPEKSVPTHLPEPVEKTFVEETHAPSFSMGAPAIDEEEPANSKKAIIILAVVVILASLAGYLGWKNMSGKSPATPAPQVQPPPTAPAPSPSSSLPASGDSNPVTAAEPTTVATSPEPVTAQPAKPSAKMIAKDSTRPVAPSAASPEEKQPSVSAPALIVHNETSKASPKAAAPDTDSASAPAPSALGLTSNPDPNALSAISNAPVAVPKASAQVVKLSQGVSEGLILKKVSPHYPAQALQMHVEGSVQLQATISKDGSISNLKILSGDPLLSRAAQDAVKQWKYKPYYLDGEPVDIQTQITINFKLPR